MRNLRKGYLDVRDSHHSGEYCSDADKYWRYAVQYLRDNQEVILGIKKDR